MLKIPLININLSQVIFSVFLFALNSQAQNMPFDVSITANNNINITFSAAKSAPDGSTQNTIYKDLMNEWKKACKNESSQGKYEFILEKKCYIRTDKICTPNELAAETSNEKSVSVNAGSASSPSKGKFVPPNPKCLTTIEFWIKCKDGKEVKAGSAGPSLAYIADPEPSHYIGIFDEESYKNNF